MSSGLADDRPRNVRMPRKARRAQLLDAASAVFVDKGYHAASMDDIADSAGVSKPVLYQHFPSKLELYLALLDDAADSIIRGVAEALSSNHDNKSRVDATVDVLFSYVSQSAAEFRLIFESDLTSDPQVVQRLNRVTAENAHAVAAVIREDTGLATASAELLSVGLVGMAQVSAQYWLSNAQQLSKEEAVALVTRLGWRGIGGIPMTE